MDYVQIRPETQRDVEKITVVHDIAFAAQGEGALVCLIRQSEAFIPELSLVAELNWRVVGHALFSKVQLTDGGLDQNSLSLAPVAVLPEFQSKTIGTQLIRKGIQKAALLGFKSILVLGDPKFYPRFGFRPELTVKIESRYSCKAYMGLELVADSLSALVKASVQYPAAFSAVD